MRKRVDRNGTIYRRGVNRFVRLLFAPFAMEFLLQFTQLFLPLAGLALQPLAVTSAAPLVGVSGHAAFPLLQSGGEYGE
jgi:hypothetical protein